MIVAYHGRPDLKTQLLDLVRQHREADELHGGAYITCRNEKPRYCMVGCSLYDLARIRGEAPPVALLGTIDDRPFRDHALFERYAGVPAVLAHIADRLFESLPHEDQVWLPEQFWQAIPAGADLSLVWPHLAVWLMTDEQFGVARHLGSRRQIADRVAALYEQRIAGIEPPVADWEQARRDADAAASAYATSAYAYAAYAYAYAADAADAAASASAYATSAYAAYAYAYAYAYAADAAASAYAYATSAFWRALRDELLRLLAAAPVITEVVQP